MKITVSGNSECSIDIRTDKPNQDKGLKLTHLSLNFVIFCLE